MSTWYGFRCRRWRRCWAALNRCTPTPRTKRCRLPTEEAARLALRTQQIIAYESGVTNTADPVGGSYHIEQLTDEIERGAREYIDRIDAMGGTLAAIEKGYIQTEIQNAAYAYQQSVERGEAVVVGVNQFHQDEPEVAHDVPAGSRARKAADRPATRNAGLARRSCCRDPVIRARSGCSVERQPDAAYSRVRRGLRNGGRDIGSPARCVRGI